MLDMFERRSVPTNHPETLPKLTLSAAAATAHWPQVIAFQGMQRAQRRFYQTSRPELSLVHEVGASNKLRVCIGFIYTNEEGKTCLNAYTAGATASMVTSKWPLSTT